MARTWILQMALLTMLGQGIGACETGGDDADEPEPCPLNSGYPCACDKAECDDGNICVVQAQSNEGGVCAAACPENQDDLCLETRGYGVIGTCAFVTGGGDTPDTCTVICEHDGHEGPCPTGANCTSMGEWSACL